MEALSPRLLSLLLLLTATFHLLPPSSSAATGNFIRSACQNARENANLCYTSFSPYTHVIKQNLAALVHVSVAVSHSVVHSVTTDISRLNGSDALEDCISTLGDARDQISDSLAQLQQIADDKGRNFKQVMDAVLTEMSAAYTNEDTCMDEILEDPDGPVKKEMKDLVTEAEKFTGIALSLVGYYAKNGSV